VSALAKATGHCSQIFVYIPVTIVIDSVTDFRSGSFEGIAFVSNAPDAGLRRMEALALAACQHWLLLVRLSVTVVVESIADLVKCPLPGIAHLGETALAVHY
jgi:hypothetical protein